MWQTSGKFSALKSGYVPTIEDLANYAEIIGMLSLIGGILWGVVQLRELRQQRSEAAAIELVRSWHTPEFTKALRMVQTVPDSVEPDEFRAADPSMEDMAFVVCLMFESTGVMVASGTQPPGFRMVGMAEGSARRTFAAGRGPHRSQASREMENEQRPLVARKFINVLALDRIA